MKKIIATVLAMVMALALCATAFAADAQVSYYAAKTSDKDLTVSTSKVTFDYYGAKDPTVKDGKTTAKGNVAYYVTADTAYAGNYVVVSSLGEADVVLYTANDSSKNVVMYLSKVSDPAYLAATAFTNFGTSCGQYKKPADYSTSKTYYLAERNGNDVLYVAASTGSESVMVNGKLVAVNPVTAAKVEHSAVPTVKDGKVVGYTCSVCKCTAVEAPNAASVPAGAQIITGNWYFPAAASSTTNTNKSPKTFDAGIAMYVGMALTSVAGSAVVIGKKKEF